MYRELYIQTNNCDIVPMITIFVMNGCINQISQRKSSKSSPRKQNIKLDLFYVWTCQLCLSYEIIISNSQHIVWENMQFCNSVYVSCHWWLAFHYVMWLMCCRIIYGLDFVGKRAKKKNRLLLGEWYVWWISGRVAHHASEVLSQQSPQCCTFGVLCEFIWLHERAIC